MYGPFITGWKIFNIGWFGASPSGPLAGDASRGLPCKDDPVLLSKVGWLISGKNWDGGGVMSWFPWLEVSSGLCTGRVFSASFAFKLMGDECRCFDSESESSGRWGCWESGWDVRIWLVSPDWFLNRRQQFSMGQGSRWGLCVGRSLRDIWT